MDELRGAGRPGRGDLPGRQDRGRADRAARRRGARAAAVDRPGRVRPRPARPRRLRTLGLQTYLTAGPEGGAGLDDPGRARPRRRRPGVIHTDFQRGFIKAEVVSYDDLVAAGSMAEAKAARQGAHRGQGLRHGGRRRRGVPLQRLSGSSGHPSRCCVHEPLGDHDWVSQTAGVSAADHRGIRFGRPPTAEIRDSDSPLSTFEDN